MKQLVDLKDCAAACQALRLLRVSRAIAATRPF